MRRTPNPVAVPPATSPLNTNALHALLGQPTCPGCASGSNNWVIAGTHTASGKPLLSNDMHLTLREPDTWYMADLSWQRARLSRRRRHPPRLPSRHRRPQ